MARQLLGQVFYGRGPDGYGVLGVSPGGRSFLGTVAAICRAVGSPDRPGDISAFLIGKREGPSSIMVRACRGNDDPTGRATIFFHALIAEASALREAGLDAFVLADCGLFKETCPEREPTDLPFPKTVRSGHAERSRSIDLPATISSERPLDDIVLRELGPDSLEKNWATYSYNPLSGFDLCVLSTYSPRKGDGIQYVFDVSGLHRLSPDAGLAVSRSDGPPPRDSSVVRKMQTSLPVTLAANAVLLLALILRGGCGTGLGGGVSNTPVELTEEEAKERWSEKWREEWMKSLPVLSPAMTEAEARELWGTRWKAQWEESLPPPIEAVTDADAREKWEKIWKTEWTDDLKNQFGNALRASGGEWPIMFDADESPFVQSVRERPLDSDDDSLATKKRIYQSCKACADFVQGLLEPTPTQTH